MGTNQFCRIVVGISSQIGRDGHRDMGDVSTYGKIIRNLLGSIKPTGSNLCADTRRYKYLRAPKSLSLRRVSIQKPASRISQLSRRENGSIFLNTNL